jgi:hypothetical protein
MAIRARYNEGRTGRNDATEWSKIQTVIEEAVQNMLTLEMKECRLKKNFNCVLAIFASI